MQASMMISTTEVKISFIIT